MTLLHQAAQKAVEALPQWTPLPENADERAMFDRATELHEDVRLNIAQTLRMFAVAHPHGSYAELCRIMANEVAKLVPPALQQQEVPSEPVAWIRWVGSDGGYEGPIMNHSMEEVRKRSGAWTPLYAHPPTGQQLEAGEFTHWARAALLWVLWHHQGGSSKVGQPIRFALGKDQHEPLSDWEVAQARKWEAASPSTTRQQEAGSDALDAQRYRWLRQYGLGIYWDVFSDDEAMSLGTVEANAVRLDSAIDRVLAAAPSTPENAGGVKGEKDGYRTCNFCGCHTNAKVRACCENGHAADRYPDGIPLPNPQPKAPSGTGGGEHG